MDLKPIQRGMRSFSPWCLPPPLPGDHKPRACRQARELPHQPCLNAGSTGSSAAVSSWDAHAAPGPVHSDLLERVFTEGNEQLPWLLFILPGSLLRAAALLITGESPSSVFSNKLVRVNLFMLCCLQ